MPEAVPRLVLLTPHGVDGSRADAIHAALDVACAAADVAAVVLRLRAGDERALVNLVKRTAPAVQRHGAAVVIAPDAGEGEAALDAVAVSARGGADGVHVEGAPSRDLRERLREGRILGCGGVLDSRHAAMAAGESGADYLLFGGRDADGAVPDAEAVRERAAWWAEIFETPCIAVAVRADEVAGLAATGAEFVGLDAALWLDDPEAVRAAAAALATAGEKAGRAR